MVGTKELLEKVKSIDTAVQLWKYNDGEVTETMSDLVALSKNVRKYLEGNKRSRSQEKGFMIEFAFIVSRL